MVLSIEECVFLVEDVIRELHSDFPNTLYMYVYADMETLYLLKIRTSHCVIRIKQRLCFLREKLIVIFLL
jgi:hypothetical protein